MNELNENELAENLTNDRNHILEFVPRHVRLVHRLWYYCKINKQIIFKNLH